MERNDEDGARARLNAMPLAELRARVEVAHRAVQELAALAEGIAHGPSLEARGRAERFAELAGEMVELLPLVRLTPEERERMTQNAPDEQLLQDVFDDYDREPEKYAELGEDAAESMAQARDAHERMKLYDDLSIAMRGLLNHLDSLQRELLGAVPLGNTGGGNAPS